MKTLLIHALRSEAGVLKQHYPQAVKHQLQNGLDLLGLDQSFDLTRTGVGLERTQKVLELIPAEHYELVIHFGVSGSLDDGLPIHTLVRSHRFMASNQPVIMLDPLHHLKYPMVMETVFFSSLQAVTDETQREQIAARGAGAVDMESYAVAEFCQTRQLPLLALRCISDRAGSSTSTDFRRNYEYASQKLQSYLLKNLLLPARIKA